MTFSRFFHVVEEGGGGERQRERLLAAASETQELFVLENMTATEANNRKGDDIGIEIPDTAHQVSTGLLIRLTLSLYFFLNCYFYFPESSCCFFN